MSWKTLVAAVASLSLTLGAWSNAPAHECPFPDDTVESLHHCVEHAIEMGHIDNDGVGNSLLAKVEGAQAAVDRGENDVAVNQLEAFIHEVEAQSGVHIDAEHAAHMVEHAGHVIDALQ